MSVETKDTPGLDPKAVGRLLDQIVKHGNDAFKAYQRYARRPGGIGGEREFDRYLEHEKAASGAIADLRAAISKAEGR
jgi:hypothetical protein